MSEEKKVIYDKKIVVASPTDQRKKSEAETTAPAAVKPSGESHLRAGSDVVAQAQPAVKQDSRPVLMFVVTRAMWLAPQRYIVQLAQHFSQTHKIHLVFGSFEFTGKNVLREQVEAVGGTVHTIDTLGHKNILANEFATIFALWKIFREVKPQVVHYNDGKVSLLGGIAGMLSGVSNSVATIHGFPSTEHVKSHEIAVVNFFVKLSYGMSKQIITREMHIHKTAENMFGEKKTNLILPGIHEVNFTKTEEKMRAIAQDAPAAVAGKLRTAGTLILGNVAPLDEDQGMVFLLQALKQLKEAGREFVYMHYGDGDQKHLLDTEITQFGLDDHVLFKGTDKMASSYFPLFDIVVHPTLRPGVPQIVRDLALAERALIITKVLGIEDSIAETTEAVIIPTKDSNSIYQAIVQLADDPEQRRSMGAALKARVTKDYDEAAMFKQTKSVYGI